ncbi:hypothetical protein MMC21_004607 [Puttea exsequens]|nr:hypothetical protein [Puttea exsequens]
MRSPTVTDKVSRRLSKPRTNTSSTNLLSTSEQSTDSISPMNSSISDYFGDNAVVVNSQGESRSRRKSRSKIRAYLYGPYSEVTQTSSDDEDSRTGLAGAARDARRRISRTGSSIMQIQSAKASTTRLSKSESQSSDLEDSAVVADQIKQRAYYDSLAAQNHISPPVDEEKHPDSVLAPVRRKSLFTPGLATRTPDDILRKPPPRPKSIQSQIDHGYYHDPTKPEDSPLSQLAALRIAEDGRSTPSSLHYAQLGGLQLGTLRVTNGTASPTPQDQPSKFIDRHITPEIRPHDEHHTASQGSMTGGFAMAFPQRRDSPLRFSDKEETAIDTPDLYTPTPTDYFPRTQESPDRAVEMAHEYISELEGSPFRFQSPVPQGHLEDQGQIDDAELVVPRADDLAAEDWRQMIEEAELRQVAPLTREDAFDRLNGARPGAQDCERLSVPSSMTSRYSIAKEVPKTDSGYCSNASLNSHQQSRFSNDDHERGTEAMASAGPPRRCILSGSRELPQRVSLLGDYSLQPSGPAPKLYSFDVIPRNAILAPAPNSSALENTQTVSPIRPSARSMSSTIVRKLQKARPKSQPPPTQIHGAHSHKLSQADIPRVPSVMALRHADRLRGFPVLEHTFPSPQHTRPEAQTSPTDPPSMPYRFPSPANALEAATAGLTQFHPEEKKRRRSWLISKQRASGTTDDQDASPSSIKSLSNWSDLGSGKPSKLEKRRAKEERERTARLVREEKELEKRLEKDRKGLEKQLKKEEDRRRSRSRSASRLRGKSSERQSSQYATLTPIADFGTVTESLGASPYDIATSMFPNASQNASWHPHQISTAMPGTKAMVAMDGETAAEAGRERSRARSQSFGRPKAPIGDIFTNSTARLARPQTMIINASPIPALAAVDLRGHRPGFATRSRRSQSFGGTKAAGTTPFNDRGGLPGRSLRPSSLIIDDPPPVPTLLPASIPHQREAQANSSGPDGTITNPLRPITTDSQKIELAGAMGSGSPSSRSNIMMRPRKTRASKLVPDLWSHGSLEKKVSKAPVDSVAVSSNEVSSNEADSVAENSSVWEAQRRAWSQRRRSAGEALLKNQIKDMFDGSSSPKPRPVSKKNDRQSSPSRPLTAPAYDQLPSKSQAQFDWASAVSHKSPLSSKPVVPTRENFENSPSACLAAAPQQAATQFALRPGPSPLAQPPPLSQQPNLPSPAQRRAQPHSFNIPRKRVGSGTSVPTMVSTLDRLTGRYAGGLQYGYEPGQGLGGSAGTRGARTEASRKSVDVSKGFGLDLSDVPIFVAPAGGVK